jgi:hypothetical protein
MPDNHLGDMHLLARLRSGCHKQRNAGVCLKHSENASEFPALSGHHRDNSVTLTVEFIKFLCFFKASIRLIAASNSRFPILA